MHIEPSPSQMAAFVGDPRAGPMVMLNLLRFRDEADYSRSPELAPADPIKGVEAYARYGEHVMPLLAKAGAEVLYQGVAAEMLIGPEDESWDLAVLVRYPSAGAFMAFATDAAYLAGVGHRTAALVDSRLLPTTPRDPA